MGRKRKQLTVQQKLDRLEKLTASAAARSKKYALSDLYYKKLIRNSTGLEPNQITPELIELKRGQITIYRMIKGLKNELNKSRD